jgi:hypothetical protein
MLELIVKGLDIADIQFANRHEKPFCYAGA